MHFFQRHRHSGMRRGHAGFRLQPAKARAAIFCSILGAAVLFACTTKTPTVCIEKKDHSRVCVTVETARTQSQRQFGLMFRSELAPDSGMLFFFEAENKQAFTMRNTRIPLDMIFISRTKRIAGIVENARPLTDGPYEVPAAALYVLEVNGSFCREHGIAVGDTVLFESLQ